MRTIIFAATLAVSVVTSSYGAFAWSEQNCLNTCKKSAHSPAGYSTCVAQNNCAQYKGGHAAGTGKEDATASAYLRAHSKPQ
jgi:hypothetical protein